MSDEPFGDAPEDDGGELSPESTFNAADPVAVRKRQRRVVRADAESRKFWEGVFASEVGRREMWAILKAAGAFDVRFSHGPVGFPDPQATWFHLGQTKFGMYLYHEWMKQARDGVLTMLDEHSPQFARPK